MERLTTDEAIAKNLSPFGPPRQHHLGYKRSRLTSREIRRLMKSERRKLAKLKNKSKGQ